MNKFMLLVFNIGIVALILFAKCMPERICDRILERIFYPVKDSPQQISRKPVEQKI